MSRRQQRRAERTATFWASKLAAATTPTARAAVAWDQVRAAISDLPAEQQPAAWSRVVEQMSGLAREARPAP